MQGMILTVLSSAAGSAAGCILSLYLGRPGKRAKVDPFSKRILPLCAGFFLMALAIPAAPGILKLILSVFFSSFTLTGLGTAKGLEDRDQDLLEMAYVFFIPDKSRITYIDLPARITYIDLPACRDKIVLSAMIAGPVSAVIGSAALFAAGSTPSIPHQIAAGILLLALAALGKNLLKKNPGKGDSAA